MLINNGLELCYCDYSFQVKATGQRGPVHFVLLLDSGLCSEQLLCSPKQHNNKTKLHFCLFIFISEELATLPKQRTAVIASFYFTLIWNGFVTDT